MTGTTKPHPLCCHHGGDDPTEESSNGRKTSVPGSVEVVLRDGHGPAVLTPPMHHVVPLVGWFNRHNQVVAVGHQHVSDLRQ